MSQIAVITSISQKLYDLQVYGRCLDSWHYIPYHKILFSEDGLQLPGFRTVDLAALCNSTGYFDRRRPSVLARFYRKALSITWALQNLEHDIVIWLDSDVEALEPWDRMPDLHEGIATMFYPLPWQTGTNIAQGGVDTGIICFDRQQLGPDFANDYIAYWHSDRIQTLAKPKDTYVLIDMMDRYPMQNLMQHYQLLPSGSNYFDHTLFQGRLYHHIGRAKK